MTKLPVLKCRDLIRALEKAGFYLHHQTGSHAQFKHEDNRRTTIPMHTNKDIKTGILKAILRDTDLTIEELLGLL